MRRLTFRQILQKLALINIRYAAPYGNGTGYFVGKDTRAGYFPYPYGPIVFVSEHNKSDVIPARVINNWLDQLELSPADRQQFWSAQGKEEGTSGEVQDSK